MNRPPQLHVATYHYVRDLPRTRFPKIKGMLLDDFRAQAKALPDLFEMATVSSMMEFLTGRYQPRRDMCLMTFDDGVRDHYEDVTPILAEEGIQGVFFLISGCMEDHVVAPVHMNHFLMASLDFEEYRSRFLEAVRELGFDDRSLEIDSAIAQRTYPLDTVEVARFKLLFNFLAPPAIRDAAVKKLFVQCLGNEEAFSKELYLSWAEAREMQKTGMSIGGHTDTHRPLSTLDDAELERDLTRCWQLSQKHLHPQQYWPFSYPYGKSNSFNGKVISQLRRLGFHLSLCTEKGLNLPGVDLFAIRRLDCKDIMGAGQPERVSVESPAPETAQVIAEASSKIR
jgi:peptidoglycan/xylan/chitin deacetylase (PgdA/CDA1 family)